MAVAFCFHRSFRSCLGDCCDILPTTSSPWITWACVGHLWWQAICGGRSAPALQREMKKNKPSSRLSGIGKPQSDRHVILKWINCTCGRILTLVKVRSEVRAGWGSPRKLRSAFVKAGVCVCTECYWAHCCMFCVLAANMIQLSLLKYPCAAKRRCVDSVVGDE